MSSTRDHLQRKTADLSLNSKQLGLIISKKKTKTMQMTNAPLPVRLENEDIAGVEESTYLGSIVSKNNATEKDITNRLQKAKSPFFQLNKIWRSHSIRKKTKIKIYRSNILSVLLYGAECRYGCLYQERQPSNIRLPYVLPKKKLYWPQKIRNEALY